MALALLASTFILLPSQATAAPEDATIRVQKAGLREGLSRDLGASGLAGATFVAYRKGNARDQNIPAVAAEATCVTDANGTCDLLVDSDSSRYLVVETAAPAGWSVIDKIALGRFNESGTDRLYRWNVGVEAGETSQVPLFEIENTNAQNFDRERPNPAGDLGRGDYRWANVRDNPLVPDGECGLSIALMFDQSGSIGSNLPLVQGAATDFVDQLTGTPTEIALFTFSTNSPQNSGDSRNRPNLVSIADAAGAATVNGFINGLSPAGGGTNWDHGLREIAAATPNYDLAIVLTDGNPTAWRGETSSTSDVDDYDVEEAVHSANWLKELGTRVIAIGFSGQAGGLTSTNLALISGPNEGNPSEPKLTDDYFLTTFGELADLLSDIALNNCGGTINVTKKISPTWTDIGGLPLEPNWPFESPNDYAIAQPDPPGGQTGTTGPSGEPLTYRVEFGKLQLERDVTIFEPDLGPNLPIPDPNGLNAQCTITGESDPNSRVVNVGDNGVTVLRVRDKEIVSCQFVNSPLRLQALKYEDTNGDGDQDPGEPPLAGWTIFLDDNGNSVLDGGEISAVTDDQGTVLFDRLPAEGTYRVCEVLQGGFFNTDPGGGAVCKDQLVEFPDQPIDPVPPAGPVEFGNVAAGGFTVTKVVDDTSGLVPPDIEYTIEVSCTPSDQPLGSVDYPITLTLENGETAAVGPLIDGTVCTIDETDSQGAEIDIDPDTVTIPADDGVDVVVTNSYPVGSATLAKVTAGDLAELAPEGTEFTIEVTCAFPAGYPVQGTVPGFDPLELVVEAGPPGVPGPAVDIGPLPVGTTCDFVETDDRGASDVVFTPDDQIVITDSNEPIAVEVTNTFEAAALRILKEVQGAVLPPETEFTADVVCTFGGQTTFDGEVTFGVGPERAGLVTDQPVGAECTVTETGTGGASEVIYDPGQTVTLEGPSPVSVDITITNVFETGELVITKEVDDGGSGLVPDGTSFTLAVDCTFQGNSLDGYPRDVTLTIPTPLTETITDLPVGSECTVTETDDAGASDVQISPDQPVTITPSGQGSVEVTVTNVFETDAFEVTKEVEDPSGLIPPATEYTITVTCTYPADYPATGEIPGFDPLTLMLTAGETVSTGQLPVGSQCVIAETDAAGAGAVEIDPDTVIVGEGTEPVLVTVTNTYPVGELTLRKAVDDGGSGVIPIGTEYVLRVECSFPNTTGFPNAGQPIPGFDPLDVTVESGVGGNPGVAVVVGPLPVGSSCTVSEPDPQGASSVVITPDQPVTVPADTAEPVEVVATNVYPVGDGEVVKVADGDLADLLAPPGTPFLVSVTCEYPTGFPVSGVIPGFDGLVLVITSGQPGQPGTPAPFGPLPIGSSCVIEELIDIGFAEPVVDPNPYIIGQTDPAEVTVTNSFNAIALLIEKTIDGDGSGLVPPGLEYQVDVSCRLDRATNPYYESTVAISVGESTQLPGPGEIAGLIPGTFCEVTESESFGADVTIEPEGEFQLPVGDESVVVDVTVTNTFDEGALEIIKDVTGELAGLVPPDTEYTIGVACSIGGEDLVGFPINVVLTPTDDRVTITGLPVGAECFASEADTVGAASPPSFDPPGSPDFPFRSGAVTITDDLQDPISITVINEYPPAFGEIVKVVDGPQAGLIPPGTEFVVAVTCSFPDDHPAAPGIVPGFDGAEVTITAGDTPGEPGPPTEFGPVPPGSSCEFQEIDDQGANDVAIEPSQVIVEDDDELVQITVTNTFDEGGLTLTKVVDGDGAEFVPPGTVYTVQVDCSFRGDPVFADSVELVVGVPVVIDGLPIGAECTIEEIGDQGADDVVITPPSPVTIVAGTATVDVTITNTYRVGDFDIVKVVDGELADLIPPGTTFAVDVTCAYPATFPAQGPIPGFDPLMTTIAAGQPGQPGPPTPVGPLPVGSTCTIAETDGNGASDITIVPDQVTVPDPVDEQPPISVVVTNTFDSAALRVIKVLDGPGAPLLPPDTEFRASVVCTPPEGNPSDGFDDEVTFGVDDPAIIAGLPVGSTCTITETETSGATDVTYSPDQTVVLEGEGPVSVDVTITNTIGAGSLVIEKALDGDGAPFVPPGTVFLLDVDCAFDGTQLDGFPQELQLAAPDGSASVDGLPLGSTCTVTETDAQGAQDVVISPAQPVTITESTAVEVVVTNTFGTGGLVIDKVLVGSGAPLAPGPFNFELSCTFLGQPMDPQPIVPSIILPSTSTEVDGIPIGATCTVQELEPFGGAVGPPTIVPSSVTIGGDSEVAFTVTNTFEFPALPPTGSSGPRQPLTTALAAVLIGLALWLVSRRLPGRQAGRTA